MILCGIVAIVCLTVKLLMTDIQSTESGTRRRPGYSRAKKLKIRVDMTPMVDLGFLLIAFFVITAELNKPSVVHLNMPKEGGPPTPLGESNALTLLLDANNTLYCYHGDWKKALSAGEIFETNFSISNGVGKIIREKQQRLDATNKTEGRNGLMLLIKPGAEASYQNVVDALDEATINVVKKYAIVKIEPEESAWMKSRHQ
jgi:biopolymer transport protein ExbD